MSTGITDIRYVCLSDMHLGAEGSQCASREYAD
jgi:hypothetical protein